MSFEPPCLHCHLRRHCLGEGLDTLQLSQLNWVHRRRTPLRTGDTLAWEGDTFRTLYAVRSGALKSMSIDAYGQERVRGFHLPGELIGLDALDGGTHLSSVESLTDCEVCELPVSRLEQALDTLPPLRRHITRLLSRTLATALNHGGDFTAEQRIAAFLVDMARRQSTETESPQLQLEMSRRDIANYLRLVTETVSRVLARLRDAGVIRVNRRRIQILDPAALQDMAGSLAPRAVTPAAWPRAA